jgi:hypothetical protein
MQGLAAQQVLVCQLRTAVGAVQPALLHRVRVSVLCSDPTCVWYRAMKRLYPVTPA